MDPTSRTCVGVPPTTFTRFYAALSPPIFRHATSKIRSLN